MVSMVETASGGIVFRSMTRYELIGWARRPSSNTRVRLVPSPRRSTVAAPGAAVGDGNGFEDWLRLLLLPATLNCGSDCRAFTILGLERFSMAAASTVTMGLSEVKSLRAMREPVTMTSCSGFWSEEAGALGVWAAALFCATRVAPAV